MTEKIRPYNKRTPANKISRTGPSKYTTPGIGRKSRARLIARRINKGPMAIRENAWSRGERMSVLFINVNNPMGVRKGIAKNESTKSANKNIPNGESDQMDSDRIKIGNRTGPNTVQRTAVCL